MKWRSVIFDWDGTLAMTLHHWLLGYRTELEEQGHAFSDDHIVRDFFYEHDRAAEKYPDIQFEPFVRNVRAYVSTHANSLGTYPGARVMLESLRQDGVGLYLVSSSPRQLLKAGLESTGLLEFFPLVVGGDDVMRHKPDPEPFNQVIEGAKLDRTRTLMLGDSHNDIVAAKRAGISSCLFLPEENKLFYDFALLRKEDPDHTVTSLSEFATLARGS